MSKYKIYSSIVALLIISGIFIYSGVGDTNSNVKKTIQENTEITKKQNELVMVYIGSSTCPACNDARLAEVVSGLQENLEKLTDSMDVGFTMIGLSNEDDTHVGFEYLSELAPFNEISMGNI